MTEMQKMIDVRRITVITPEFSEPLLNQQLTISSKIKSMGLMGSGTCSYTCTLEKDVLYPMEYIRLGVAIDNAKCSKKIEKYKLKLLRRTQAFDTINAKKPLYINDQLIYSEKKDAKCEAKASETLQFEFQIPQSIFQSQAEEDLFKIPLAEKPLSSGPSSSISGRLYKVQYVLQFSLKHQVMGATQRSMPETQIPVMIMTPNKSCF
jgi:hypothetical protein